MLKMKIQKNREKVYLKTNRWSTMAVILPQPEGKNTIFFATMSEFCVKHPRVSNIVYTKIFKFFSNM